jgi:simple sugar transport system permease protein
MNKSIAETKSTLKGIIGRLNVEGQTLRLLAIVSALILFFALTEDRFLTPLSITSMGFQLPEIGILSLAMMVTIIIGGINLSINATSNLGAVLAGIFMVQMIPEGAAEGSVLLYMLLAVAIFLVVGLLTGVLNGLLVGHIGVPPILATLGTASLYTGISTGLTEGRTVTGFPSQVQILGSETLLGIPLPFLIFVLLAILTYIILNRTSFGFKIRMVGTNPAASNFSGIDNKSIIMRTYIYSGLLSAVAGMIVMSRTASAAYEYGSKTYVLSTILIAVLAGLQRGFGSVFNVSLAVIILQVLSTGSHMLLRGVRGSSFFKDFSWGVLLVIIFIVNYFVRDRELHG